MPMPGPGAPNLCIYITELSWIYYQIIMTEKGEFFSHSIGFEALSYRID